MEYRGFALRLVSSPSLDVKLTAAPMDLTDRDPGPPLRLERPARSPELEIQPSGAAKVPPLAGMQERAQRVRILHAFANHELQAAELFAWALLAFPEAPAQFRRGLLRILDDEQRHCRMYIARLAAFGARMGDHPVSGYFWNKVESLATPLHFVCAMSLTFENANLDHTIDYAAEARRLGDRQTAALIETIHRDEIEHVRFGYEWLRRFKDEGQSPWEAYCAAVQWPLRGALARGREFHPEGRQIAGLDDEFIEALRRSER